MIKRRLTAAVLTAGILLGVTGCTAPSPEPEKGKKQVEITMHLWDTPMSKELTPWLEQQFPDIHFTFVLGYNTMDYYSDLSERGILPDIITCRRFSLNDAAHLSDQLMDLSQTEVAGTFYDSYLENNREPGGAIRWLPMCAEVDGYLANVDVFKKYDIPLPTNYAEFADACRRFEEFGITGYANDYRSDYSCLEALQGSSIPRLMSADGIQWRMAYENDATVNSVGLDETVWPEVFETFEQYIADTYIKPWAFENSFRANNAMLQSGQAAMIRGTASDCTVIRQTTGIDCVMLPYFGETSADNWLLTYPIFQVGVSRAVEQDPEKARAVRRVLDAMFSEEGQRLASVNNAVLSYNKNVSIELNDAFREVADCISRNHLYIRLASTRMFSVSRAVVQKMLRGEYGAQDAYQDFHARLLAPSPEPAPAVTVQNTGYENLTGKHGNPAASAVVNTIRQQMGADIAVGYSNLITAPVFAGEYTAQQLNWLVANRVLLRRGELTGEELLALIDWLVSVKEDGSNPIRHRNLLPVTGGMEYTMTDNGGGAYTLGTVTVNGKPLDKNAVYSVLMLGDNDYIESYVYCNCPMPPQLRDKMELLPEKTADVLSAVLSGNAQMVPPTDYLTILS